VILCVAANPSVDRLFTVDRLVPGEIHRPADLVQVAGGKGLNVARAVAALGGDAEAVALLGGHAGRWIAQELEREGVVLHDAPAAAETRSSLSVAGAPEGLTEFYEHGLPLAPGEWAGLVELVIQLAPRAGWMTVSGSLPVGAPPDAYVLLVPLTCTAFDSRAAGIDAGPAVVKLNENEAALATGLATDDAAGALAAAQALQARSGGTAVVTRGRAGAIMVTRDGEELAGRLDATGAFPVGSGDAFLAGLVVALDRGAGWPDALRAALGAGAANAELPGAGRLERDRAERLAERAAVTTPAEG
jgi:1-phosphofructokinase family hexose kinase